MSYLPDLIAGLMNELKSYFTGISGMAIYDTDLQDDITAIFPLCVLEVNEAPESARLPGNGLTRMDYSISLRVYAYEPNAYNANDGDYSTGLLQIIDDLRVYFQNEVYQTTQMQALSTNYGFRLTYKGTSKAEAIQIAEKICKGFTLNFETIGFDSATRATVDFPDTNQNVSGNVVFD